jgi:hypothetical protein
MKMKTKKKRCFVLSVVQQTWNMSVIRSGSYFYLGYYYRSPYRFSRENGNVSNVAIVGKKAKF